MILNFLILTLIVGIVTAFINVRYDRFFILLLIIFLFGNNIDEGVEILLWTIFFGSAMILSENKSQIRTLPKETKIKLFIIIPLITIIPSFLGSYLFSVSSNTLLLIVLAVITLIYALRMIFVHFKPEEMNFKGENKKFLRLCSLLGPIISGLSLGFIGTSLKAVKIPFAVKVGKLNMKQVYLMNTFTAFSAAGFSLVWHNTLFAKETMNIYFARYFLMAAALWTVIHFIAKITATFVKPNWQKNAQFFVGIFLLLAFAKLIMIIA